MKQHFCYIQIVPYDQVTAKGPVKLMQCVEIASELFHHEFKIVYIVIDVTDKDFPKQLANKSKITVFLVIQLFQLTLTFQSFISYN